MPFQGEEFDSFWDLSSMLKNKHKQKKKEEPAPAIECTKEVVSSVSASSSDAKKTSIALELPRSSTKLIKEYKPSHSPFLLKVRLYRNDSKYSFYSSFREDALRYFNQTVEPMSPVPYFSYIPQYSQMTRPQLNFYFYFRQMARQGEFISCDLTYFWLYIYEIINLPDKVQPSEGIKLMCKAWAAFRDRHPKIDKYMTVWLADYCLVNELACPTEYLGRFLPAILEHAGFKEFYLGHALHHDIFGVHTLLSLVSSYQWQKSKFLLSLGEKDRNQLLLSLAEVVKRIYEDPALFSMDENVSVMSRDAYSGSLCGQNIKCKIEVLYHKIENVGKISDVVTAALKYAENKLRILHGQKSRLTVGESLLTEHRQLIDAYFEDLMPKATPKVVVAPKAEYEKQYDAASEAVSFSKALDIENNSWENTRKLVEDTEEDTQPTETFDEPILKSTQDDVNFGGQTSVDAQRELLVALLERETIPFDFETVALCEEINNMFLSEIGDVVITITETECTLIEDYREEIETWLQTK